MFRHVNSQFSERVREYFTRYGPTVCHSIVLESQKPGGLKRLMDCLGIPEGLSDESQLDALDDYIQQHGVNAFLEKLILSLQSENKELNRRRPMSRPIAPHPGDDQPLRPVSSQPSAEAQPPQQPPTPKPAPQLAQAHAVFNAGGQYLGPERRSGVERRSGSDRRNLLHAIEGNKRFGSDRRQTIRRVADMAKSPRELGMS